MDAEGEQKVTLCITVRSPSQEIHRLVWNVKVHYRVHKSPPQVPIVIHLYQINTLPHRLPEISFNIILSSVPRYIWFIVWHYRSISLWGLTSQRASVRTATSKQRIQSRFSGLRCTEYVSRIIVHDTG
jgi:hypothetical protein